MLRIGVTGGIGSGKSTACRILRQHGIPVISADEVAHEITDSNPSVRKNIIRLLGSQAYGKAGHLNRPFVASRLFGNRRIQKAVNAIVHPPTLREIDRRLRRHEKRGRRAAAVEAALIFEAGADKSLDLIVVLETDTTKVVQRIRKRDGLSVQAVKRRIASQWSPKRKEERADILIRNNGTVADLRKKIRFLLRLLHLIPGGTIHA